jgi:outer membrane protein assembly factor BamD
MTSRRFSRLLPAAALLGVGLLAAACAGDKKDEYVERPVEELYNTAQDAVAKGDYAKAAKDFDEVDRQHPYSVWATKAQLMAAYVLYRSNKYDEAILAANRYKELHPGNKDVAYAYYLIAISYYEQIADVGRDQKITDQALSALQEVLRRFPNTEYARDAKLKLDLARDHLAGKEMAVGRYYLKRGEYLAAINRFRVVVEKFQTTSHVPEALERLTECYLALGVVDEAQTAAAVLGHNYPGSDWYQYSYTMLTGQNLQPVENSDSWMSRVWGSVF